jgi:hypothetical protein
MIAQCSEDQLGGTSLRRTSGANRGSVRIDVNAGSVRSVMSHGAPSSAALLRPFECLVRIAEMDVEHGEIQGRYVCVQALRGGNPELALILTMHRHLEA